LAIILKNEFSKRFYKQKNNFKTQDYGMTVLAWIGKKEDVAILDKELRGIRIMNYIVTRLLLLGNYGIVIVD